ncbi:MAG: hypothetical protein ACTHW7_08005 [Actinomycetaceae bacterium]
MTISEETAYARYRDLLRRPRTAAALAAVVAVVSVAMQVVVLDDVSGPLLVVTVGSVLVCVLATWNVVNFGRTAARRLEDASPSVGGTFSWWRNGTGGYEAMPFAYGADHQRFAYLSYAVGAVPVEIGHLASQAGRGSSSPTGRRHAYVAIRLPERLPHTILGFGHRSTVLGIRVVPEQWHRSQLVDLGFDRRVKAYVGDGGEQTAREFFTPAVVAVLARVGRTYDVEIKDRILYLIGTRSVAAGSVRRWSRQRDLVESLARALADDGLWAPIRHQVRGNGPRFGAMRADVGRAVTMFAVVVGAVVVVISALVIYASGVLE